MRSFLSVKWIFLLNTLPLLLLLLLGYGEFSVIKTLLPPASVSLWEQGAASLALLALTSAVYAGWCLRRGQELSAAYCLAALGLYSAALCWYMSVSNDLVPLSVPRWLIPTDFMLMVWTFLMPTLAHAGFALVVRLTPDEQNESAGISFGLAFLMPILVGGIVSVPVAIIPTSWQVGGWIFALGLIVATLNFFFFLVRAVYLLSVRKAESWTEHALLWKILIAAVLPTVGLLVNSSIGGGFQGDSGVFGNFSSPWFYLLALLNAVLLSWPTAGLDGSWRLVLLAGRAALFGYTFYFFIVFLPWLPLALPAIVLIGTGFLLLAPLLLFVIHVRALSEDVDWLRAHFSPRVVMGTLLAGLLALPLYVTATYYHDRRTLHAALEYVYAPDYTKKYSLDAASLASTLGTIREHKSFNGSFGFGAGQPYLSTYFNWLVLDNLMLSEAKMAELDRIFLGAAAGCGFVADRTAAFTSTVTEGSRSALTLASARSTYDARQQAWVSWVDLRVANQNPAVQAGEYRTTLTLPVGCWVSDYYLDMNGRREHGLLAEKKAAEWVYAQIIGENEVRDPGLVTYLGPDEVSLRVYPVVGRTPRQTGIQLLHKEPFTLTIDGQSVQLGDPALASASNGPVLSSDSAVVYLSAGAKKTLPLVQRQPRYHFLLDASANSPGTQAGYSARIADFLAASPGHLPVQYSLVNAYATLIPAGGDWQQQLASWPKTGGYYLAGAMRQALFQAQEKPDPATYPVLVAVTDNVAAANLPADFADFASACPERAVFYVLGPNGQPTAHSLLHKSGEALAELPTATAPAVRAWPSTAGARAYLPDTDSAAILLNRPGQVPLATRAAGKTWLTGLTLRGYGQWQTFHPAAAEENRLPFVQASFGSGILTPLTAYLALENDAQKAALRRKQEQVLNAQAGLDLEEQAEEPTAVPIDGGTGLLLVAGLLFAVWQLRRGQ